MPPAVTPQVWSTPPATAALRPPAGACTSTAVNRFFLYCSAGRRQLLPPPPQPSALRAAVTPQVWKSPPPTAAKLTPAGACTSTGLDRFVIVPSPSWPLPLAPQQ